MDSKEMRRLRGGEIGMVFQEPLHAFNPLFRIGWQIQEVLKTHTPLNRIQREQRMLSLLERVGLPEPRRVAKSYPHQLSGGMRQRAMIAQALAGEPKLLIADEPTSNLDVTLQARILELFKKLRAELSLSILLITHDMGIVKYLSDDLVVMSQGRVVELGGTKQILNNPKDPYTRQLIEAAA